MQDQKIKIAALIDFPIFRVGLEDVMSRLPGIEYQGTCSSKGLNEFVRAKRPGLFFISSREGLPGDITLAGSLKKINPQMKLAVLLGDFRDDDFKQYTDAGFSGLMLKNIDHTELEYAIRVIHGGGTYISQDIASAVFNNHGDPDERKNAKLNDCRLSRREKQVMYLVFREHTNQEIALKLNISIRTVESHRNNIIAKIGARNSIGIAKFILQHQLAGQLQTHLQE